MNTIPLSIVIPTHNRREILKEMLQSLGHQSYPSDCFEVVVIVDGSTDGTFEMLRSLRVPYRLTSVYQDSQGPSAARNRGAQMAEGHLVLFLDDDLLPDPQLVESHVRMHNESTRTVVLGRLLPDPNGAKEKRGWHIWEEQIFINHYRRMANGQRPPAGRRLYSGNFSVPREAFLAAGGFDERLKRGEDVELGFRLEREGVTFAFSPEAAAIHRGYRPFKSWCNSAYLYGRSDVLLAKDKGHAKVIPEVFGWWKLQPASARLSVTLTMERPRLHQAFLECLRVGSGALSGLRLHRLAHLGYSGIYKLQYWRGVIDEIGGPQLFKAYARGEVQGMAAVAVGPSGQRGGGAAR